MCTTDVNELTHSWLEITLTIAVCTSHTFENNFEIKQRYAKYFKESFGLGSDQHYSIKYFPKNNEVTEIKPKLSGGDFGCYRH